MLLKLNVRRRVGAPLFRQCASKFNYCNVKATQCDEVTQTNDHYAVKGHSRLLISVPTARPHATSYMWIIVTLRNMAGYWSNFRYWQGAPRFNSLVTGGPLNSGLWDLAPRN